MQVDTPKKGYKMVKTSFGKYEEIPEEWEPLTLKQVCEKIASGGTPSRTKKEYFGGDIPWVVVSDIKSIISQTEEYLTKEGLKNSSAKLWPIGTVILSTGATVGKVGIAGVELCTKQGVTGLVPKKSLYNSFLAYYLESITDVLKRGAVGATITEIYKKDLEKIFVPLPSRPEQKQIASILSNIDDTIQKTDQIIKQTQLLKKAMMQKLLTRGIGHTKFKKVKWLYGKEIEIPEEWSVLLLKELSVNGIQNGIFKRSSEFGSGVPLVNVQDLYSETEIRLNNLERVRISKNELNQYGVEKGDIFFDRSSLVLEGIGQSNIITELPEPVVFECHVMRLHPTKKIIPLFLFFFTRTRLFRDYIFSIARVATMTTISQPDLEKASVLLPPLPEQKQIAFILSNIDTQIQKEKIHKSNLERLKKGLMQKLLTGQIRVKV
jgi:type I restriction enzyme, S subunit